MLSHSFVSVSGYRMDAALTKQPPSPESEQDRGHGRVRHKMSKLVSQAVTLAPQVIAAAKPKLATFLKYARVELIPPSPAELPEVARGFAKVIRAARQGKWKDMTVKECWLNTLVFTEIICWFWAGECIGKGSIVGYQV